MWIDPKTLIDVADAYKAAAGLTVDKTVSHRVFGDSKKLRSLRAGSDITVSRFNAAMLWFASNWPDGADLPAILSEFASGPKTNEAATQ